MLERRVLVFGKTGVGKSSLINGVADLKGDEKLAVSNKAKGTTFNSQIVNCKFTDMKVTFVDTAGLSEGLNGTVSPLDAFKNLCKAVKDSEDGYDLIVHVIAKGRITETDQKNQELLKCLLGNQVNIIPVVLIVNKSEDTYSYNSVAAIETNTWAQTNKANIENLLGTTTFKAIQCTSFPDLISDDEEFTLEDRKEHVDASRQLFLKIVKKYSNSVDKRKKLMASEKDFTDVLKRLWRMIYSSFGLLTVDINNLTKQLSLILKVEESIVKPLAEDILNIGFEKKAQETK